MINVELEMWFFRSLHAYDLAFWFDGAKVTGVTFYDKDGHRLLTVREKS